MSSASTGPWRATARAEPCSELAARSRVGGSGIRSARWISSMTSMTPMFPGWHRKLYGRRPARPGVAMRRKAVDLSSRCLRQAKDLFGDLLAVGLLEKVPDFRNHSFPLLVVFWTFLCQVLANGSCRYGVASVQALLSRHGEAICSPITAAAFAAGLPSISSVKRA